MTKILARFFYISECHKRRGTIYKDSQAILAISAELMKAFF